MKQKKNIWDAFLAGDELAYEDIFRNHYEDLLRYGLKLAGEEELVKEWIQDLFLKLWEKRKQLQSVNSIKGYLLKSIRFRFIDYIRASQTEPLPDRAIPSALFSIEQEMIQKETSEERILQLKRSDC